MAYSKTLLNKGIKRRDPRMAKKGAESAAVDGNSTATLQEAKGFWAAH